MPLALKSGKDQAQAEPLPKYRTCLHQVIFTLAKYKIGLKPYKNSLSFYCRSASMTGSIGLIFGLFACDFCTFLFFLITHSGQPQRVKVGV